MPQVIVRHDTHLSDKFFTVLHSLSAILRPIIAKEASTPQIPLTADDVDWILQPYGNGTIAPKVGFEIRTPGYTDRLNKMDEKFAIWIKKVILSAGISEFVNKKDRLVMITFMSVHSSHT